MTDNNTTTSRPVDSLEEISLRRITLKRLRAALQMEAYELCKTLIETAKRHGATEQDVYELIEDNRRIPR